MRFEDDKEMRNSPKTRPNGRSRDVQRAKRNVRLSEKKGGGGGAGRKEGDGGKGEEVPATMSRRRLRMLRCNSSLGGRAGRAKRASERVSE